MSKLHEHSVLAFHKILQSRCVLEREKTDKSTQNRPDPPYMEIHDIGLGFFLSLWAMAYGHTSGLQLYQAPIMVAEKRKLCLFFPKLTVLCALCASMYVHRHICRMKGSIFFLLPCCAVLSSSSVLQLDRCTPT